MTSDESNYYNDFEDFDNEDDDDDDDDDEEEEGFGSSMGGGTTAGGSAIDAMRSMLEASWNVESMGVVPSDPQKAAEAAGERVG